MKRNTHQQQSSTASLALPAIPSKAPTSSLLKTALAISLLTHGILLSLHFELPQIIKQRLSSPPLEVALVNAKTLSKPSQADILAQANLDGGGNTDAKRRLSSPLPRAAIDSQQTQLALAQQKVAALEQETRELMRQLKSSAQVPDNKVSKDSKRLEDARAYQELSTKALELQRLEAQIAQQFDTYQKRPKKKHIGARATEYRFARYVDDWRQKVERVGNANYPEIARQQKLYGSLLLTVGIRSNGRIESIDIDHSSGKKILDAAAVKIVELASPFAAFPPEIKNDTDILYITRTWSFTREGELESSDVIQEKH